MDTHQSKSRLILSSFLMLFVELTIIRWGGANIYALSFFSNFILIASFLGIGIGFIRQHHRRALFPYASLLLGVLCLAIYHYSYQYQIQMDPKINDLDFNTFYFKNNFIPVEVTLPIIFLAVTIVMAAIADGVASTFRLYNGLAAYRLEVLGSLLGTICFSLLSFANTSPVWWGMVICVLFFLLNPLRPRYIFTCLQFVGLTLMLFSFIQDANFPGRHWSPYYKIHTLPYSENRNAIIVNGWPQQFVETVKQRTHYKPFYFKPYQHLPTENSLKNALVVGAGTGGDVAIALAQGAKHVDAVEIDPVLLKLGQQINLDHPYNDPRVSTYIDDGRSFLQHSNTTYDLVVFALPDSVMALSNISSLRLENYLFTVDGFNTVYRHLAPNGVFTLYNYYRERWIVDRIGQMLTSTFGHAPCLDTEGAAQHWLSVLTISKSPSYLQCQNPWSVDTPQKYLSPATDDHPFLYIKENTISGVYLGAIYCVLFITFLATKLTGGGTITAIRQHFDLFLMGAAFLLLEAKSVTTFALLFGSTWFVNSLVFIGILITVYCAIESMHRLRLIQPRILYVFLFLALLLAWFVPLHSLLVLPYAIRFIAATLLTFTPIYIGNLIFASRYQYCSRSTEAFGANLLGAVAGGLLEYASVMIGYRDLLIIVAALYALAIVLNLRRTVMEDTLSHAAH